MELRQLKAFIAIADHGHYGRAAVSLNLTQPAISQRIQALENELGVRLLTRSAREVCLTPAGDALIAYARALIDIENRALTAMRDHAVGFVGRLRLSYLTLWDVGIPASIVAEFRRRYPAIQLEMTSGYSQLNIDRLVAGDVDVAFVGASVGGRPGILIRPLDRHEIVVVMSANHRLTKMEAVPLECLRGEPMIAVSPGVNDALAAVVMTWLTTHIGEAPNVVRQEPPDQMAAALSQSRRMVALMTKHRAEVGQAEGLEHRTLMPTPVIEYGLAYRHDRHSPLLANFLKTVDFVVPRLPTELPVGTELLGERPAS